MPRRLVVQRAEEPEIAVDSLREDPSDQLAELPHPGSRDMLEERERILPHVGCELVLVHQNEVGVRLLSKQHQQVVARELDELVEQGLHHHVAYVVVLFGGGPQDAEKRLVFVNDEDLAASFRSHG